MYLHGPLLLNCERTIKQVWNSEIAKFLIFSWNFFQLQRD